MAIAFLSGSNGKGSVLSASSPTTTFSAHDSGATGSDRVLVIGVVYEGNTNPADVTAVTYGGVSMTHKVTQTNSDSSFAETVEFWVLAAPATGSNDIVISISQGGRDLGFLAGTWTGVDQSTITGNTAGAIGVTATFVNNIDLTSGTANSMLLCCSSARRATTGELIADTDNTQIDFEISGSGNGGFSAGLFERGPEASTGTFNCGSSTTDTNSTTTLAIELLEATGASTQTLSPSGIASAEAFGSTQINVGGVSVSPGGIASLEAFGTTVLSLVVTIQPVGIASLEAFGTPVIAPGSVAIMPASILSAEAFGTPQLVSATIIAVTSIPSEEAFGTLQITLGAVTIMPAGIGSLEAFGSTFVNDGSIIIVNEDGIISAIITDIIVEIITEIDN